MNCILCGREIRPGDPCHLILTGLAVDEENFDDHGSLGYACGCLLKMVQTGAASSN